MAFIRTQKQKELFTTQILIIYLNLSKLWQSSTIMTEIQKYQSEGSGWFVDAVTEQNLNASQFKPLNGSSCF